MVDGPARPDPRLVSTVTLNIMLHTLETLRDLSLCASYVSSYALVLRCFDVFILSSLLVDIGYKFQPPPAAISELPLRNQDGTRTYRPPQRLCTEVIPHIPHSRWCLASGNFALHFYRLERCRATLLQRTMGLSSTPKTSGAIAFGPELSLP